MYKSQIDPSDRFCDLEAMLSVSTLIIIRNVFWAANQYIIMISDDDENSTLTSQE